MSFILALHKIYIYPIIFVIYSSNLNLCKFQTIVFCKVLKKKSSLGYIHFVKIDKLNIKKRIRCFVIILQLSLQLKKYIHEFFYTKINN